MAARGSVAKEEITNKLLEYFSGSFKYDKEIRIPYEENGELLQIKCVLTCAKVNVENGGDTAVPGAAPKKTLIEPEAEAADPVELTGQEKKEVEDLMSKLNLL